MLGTNVTTLKKRSNFLFEDLREVAFNKQMKPELFQHGNVRVTRMTSLLKKESIFGDHSIPLIIPNLFGFDADNADDISLAQELVRIAEIQGQRAVGNDVE